VSLIKGARVVVFRIDNERERANAKSVRTHGGVHNERPAKAAAAIVEMNREPAHEHRRHCRMARQTRLAIFAGMPSRAMLVAASV
jgi:hypothetical protein